MCLHLTDRLITFALPLSSRKMLTVFANLLGTLAKGADLRRAYVLQFSLVL